MKCACLLVLILAMSFVGSAQKSLSVSSPNGRIVFNIKAETSFLRYSVEFGGRQLVQPSRMHLQFSETSAQNNIQLGKALLRNGSEDYTLIVGKRKQVKSRYRELVLPVIAGGG